MKRIRVIGVCLIAIAAIGAFAATAALASGPVFFTKAEVGATAPGTAFTGTIGLATLEPFPSKDKVVCKVGKSTGEVTGAKTTANTFITFTECEGSSTKCNTVSAPAGTIDVGPLVGNIGSISPSKPGVKLEALGGGTITEIKCGGVLEVTVNGAIFGTITGFSKVSIAASKFATSVSLGFKEKNGVQEFRKFEGEGSEHQLEGPVNGKTEKQGQTATAKLASVPVSNLGVTEK